MGYQLELKKFDDNDMAIFKEWLSKPHVLKYFKDPNSWIDEINKRNDEYKFIHHFIIYCEDKKIGFCQYYDYKLGKETWHNNIDINNTFSIDYMIGEEEYIGKHLGKEIIKLLTKEINDNTNALKIIVQPKKENIKSRKSLIGADYKYDSINDIFFIDLNKRDKNMEKRIIITGPSCAGKTTIGKALALEFNIPFFDLDNFVWDLTTPVPYTKWNSQEEKINKLNKALEGVKEFVMVGSMDSFHEHFDSLFTYAFLLDANDELRLYRFQRRAVERFGVRIEPDGDMYEGHIRQIEIIKNYHKNISLPNYENHKKWLEGLNIPMGYLNGEDDIYVNLDKIKKVLEENGK